MKKYSPVIILIFLISIGVVIAQSVTEYRSLSRQPEVTPTEFVKTVASTGTPEALSSTAIYCTKVVIQGQSAVQTANTSTAYLGWTSTDGAQAFKVASDAVYVFVAAPGTKYNLANWYLDVGTNSDGVVVIYE